MTKPIRAQDELGRNWLVYDEDVAWPLAHPLAKLGLKHIVLPARALILGNAHEYDVSGNIAEVDEQLITSNKSVAQYYARLVRLRDCVEWLRLHG